MVLYNSNPSTYDIVVLIFDTRTVEEWLKVVQNIQAVISRKNITDVQGAYMITNNLLQGIALTAFEHTKGNNGP
eukprot:8004511-Ditylum_brightwellii.AAC.1